MKIRHIITEGHRVNGNYHRLEEIITNLGTSATLRKSFQAKELGTSDNTACAGPPAHPAEAPEIPPLLRVGARAERQFP